MPSPDLLPAFMAATLILAYMSGPALLYTAARTIAGCVARDGGPSWGRTSADTCM